MNNTTMKTMMAALAVCAATGVQAMLTDDEALKAVKFGVSPRDLAYWDEFLHRFRTDAGDYEILVGASSADIRGKATIRIDRDHLFDD